VLPLVRLKTRLFGDYLVSMPYFNYGGALTVNDAVTQSLMCEAGALAERLGARHVEFRDTREQPGSWPVRIDKVVMELRLPESADALWSALGSKLRAQIKRPTKENISARVGGAELLDDFYEVFARNMRDLGTPVYGRELFSSILTAFPQAAFIIVAYHEGRPVAAGFLLGHRERLEIPWAASLREYNPLGPNMLMYWEALKKGIADGYKVFDFGRSSVDSGTYRFKKQCGAVERPLRWHYWLPHGAALPNLTPNNAKYRLAIWLWQRLPLRITNRIGPMLVRGLP
jgi:serine/alanine adding enzyme